MPSDFAVAFVQIGRVACEEHFSTSDTPIGRATITHWLEQAGKAELIAKRSAHVANEDMRQQRRQAFLLALARLGTTRAAAKAIGVTSRSVLGWCKRDPTFDALCRAARRQAHRKSITVHPLIVRRAAHHLRAVRNGGFIVSPAPNGEWWVGSMRRSPDELVAMAMRRGFEANLSSSLADEVGSSGLKNGNA